MFLAHNGFQYILDVFMRKELNTQNQITTFNDAFELKHIAFLLKILRIFVMAAFSTSTNESQVYTVAALVRKSSISEDDQHETSMDMIEGSRFKELQKLLEGPMGEEII